MEKSKVWKVYGQTFKQRAIRKGQVSLKNQNLLQTPLGIWYFYLKLIPSFRG
jgi:hypothetical protein